MPCGTEKRRGGKDGCGRAGKKLLVVLTMEMLVLLLLVLLDLGQIHGALYR